MKARIAKIISSLELSPGSDQYSLDMKTKEVLAAIKREIKAANMGASAFVGGSYAKGTMVKKNEYDIDVFIRFERKNFEKGIRKLKAVAQKVAKSIGAKMEVVHGSRDYYRIAADKRIIYEMIPAMKVKQPDDAQNVMDLSYFHVSYINRKLSKKMKTEVKAMKSFCSAQGVYGAESYIQGFSGYAIECLIAHYKTMHAAMKALCEKSDKIFVDPQRHYRNKNEAFLRMNESKLQSPVVCIDPTWKKRNVLASLNFETFIKFQESAREFLRKPSTGFFVRVEHTREELMAAAKEMKADFAEIHLSTPKQEGDIAGTKMKKAFRFILKEIDRRFAVIKSAFTYHEGHKSTAYIVARSKRAITLQGPPASMKKHADRFRSEHNRCFEKGGKLYAIEPVNETLNDYLKNKISNLPALKSMAITKIEVE